MKLSEYLSSIDSAASLAAAIGVQPESISQWKTGFRKVPIERCVPIERATNCQVTRRDLRPEDWHLIWPELAEKAAA